MHIYMYVFMVECMRCGGVWHVLCVLYGRRQGRLHYPTVRVGFLTSPVAWRSIPLSKRRVTVLASPSEAARWRALRTNYNRDTQTDRQTQVSDTGTHRQTAHAKREPHTMWEEENKHIFTYVCMYLCMYVCTRSILIGSHQMLLSIYKCM
jgi:hypothetical protein